MTDLQVAGLELACERVRFEPGAQRGQFRVLPLPDSAFTLAADAVVTSIGQDPDLAALASTLALDGALVRVGPQQATSLDRVWAGGDVSSMARFVTEAIGMGKRAAIDIDRMLQARCAAAPAALAQQQSGPGPARTPGELDPAAPVVDLGRIATYYHPHQARAPEARAPVAERLASGDEVQLGFDVQAALDESERCFSCGHCTHCDNCFHYCPDLAIVRSGAGYAVLTDYCKGCGICVAECPTGSMTMREELR